MQKGESMKAVLIKSIMFKDLQDNAVTLLRNSMFDLDIETSIGCANGMYFDVSPNEYIILDVPIIDAMLKDSTRKTH